MARVTRRHWLIAAAVAGAAGSALWIFVGSDEAKILAVLQRLIAGAGRPTDETREAYKLRVQQLLSEVLASGGALRAPELDEALSGGDEIATWASDMSAEFDSVRFSLDQSEVNIDKDFAHVLAIVTLFAKRAGIELRDTRRVDIRLRKRGKWRVESIDAAARTYDEPEARP